jgi:predicted DNA-binding transcriptional regulator YafY
VQGERCIRIAYVRSDGEASDRTIDPLGLVAKGNVWYLVGASGEQFRTFRVSRIRDAEVTDQIFTRPTVFDLASYWESSKNDFVGNFPQVRVIFRADPAGIDALRFTGRWSQVESIDELTGQVIMQFERTEDAVSTALAISPHIELIEPADLRDEVIARLTAALERYV